MSALLLIIVAILVPPLFQGAEPRTFPLAAEPTVVSPGGSASVVLRFTNDDPVLSLHPERGGTRVVSAPPFLHFDLKAAGHDLVVDEYTVMIPFSAAPDAPPGVHTVELGIELYYCHDIEGWCTSSEQKVVVKIEVRRGAVPSAPAGPPAPPYLLWALALAALGAGFVAAALRAGWSISAGLFVAAVVLMLLAALAGGEHTDAYNVARQL